MIFEHDFNYEKARIEEQYSTIKLPHKPGTRLSEPDMFNLWIDTYGRMYFVPDYGHDNTAFLMGYESAYKLEERGWIHLSLAYPGYVSLSNRFEPTSAQIDTMADLGFTAKSIETDAAKHMRRAVAMFMQMNQIPW